jgi:hypothetical protein
VPLLLFPSDLDDAPRRLRMDDALTRSNPSCLENAPSVEMPPISGSASYSGADRGSFERNQRLLQRRSSRTPDMRAKVVTKASNASETLQPTQTPLAANSAQNRHAEQSTESTGWRSKNTPAGGSRFATSAGIGGYRKPRTPQTARLRNAVQRSGTRAALTAELGRHVLRQGVAAGWPQESIDEVYRGQRSTNHFDE